MLFLCLFSMRQLLILLSLCLLIVSCGHTSPQDKVLLSRADSLMEAHPDSALTLLQHITDSKHLSSPDHALYALLMSQALDKNNIEVQSDSLIRIATAYYHGRKDFSHAGYAYFYLSRVEENRGDAEGRAAALLKAQFYAAKSYDYKLQGFIYGDKAREFESQRQLDSMLYYDKLALSTVQETENLRNIVVGLIAMGYSHYLMSQFDSALFYYQCAKKEAVNLHEILIKSSIDREIGLTFYYKKNYPMALHYFRLAAGMSDIFDYSKWFDIAMTYLQTNQLDSARFYLSKCKDPHEIAPDYYRLWEELYEKQGNFRMALHYSRKVTAAKDSLNQLSLKESFAGLEKKYNYQRIAAENNKLMAGNQQKMNFVLMLLLALFALVIFFLLFFLYKKKEELVLQQKIVTQEKERANLVEQQHQLKEMLKKKIDTFKQTALSPKASMQQQKTTNDTEYARQLEEALSNIDAYHNHISSRLQTQFHCLSRKEIHIALLILAGFTSSQIADLLDTSENTVNVNRSAIRKKLKIEGKSDLTDFLAHY